MHWMGYEDNTGPGSLNGPYRCYLIEGMQAYFESVHPGKNGLSEYRGKGYSLGLRMEDYYPSLEYADRLRKPTVVLTDD